MSNPKYIKGARQEREIINYLKNQGFTVIRSAGSKSEIDIVAFKSEGKIAKNQRAYLIQSKNSSLSDTAKLKLFESIAKDLYGYFFIKPVILSEDWKEEIKTIE